MLSFKTLLRYEPAIFVISILLLLGIAFSCHREPEDVPMEIIPLDTVPLDTVVIDTIDEDTLYLNPLMDSIMGTHSGKCHYQYKDNYYVQDTLLTTTIDTTYGNSLITIQRINDQQIRVDGCGWSPDYPINYPLGSTETTFEKTWVQGSRSSVIKIDLLARTITTTQNYYPVSNTTHKWEGEWSF